MLTFLQRRAGRGPGFRPRLACVVLLIAISVTLFAPGPCDRLRPFALAVPAHRLDPVRGQCAPRDSGHRSNQRRLPLAGHRFRTAALRWRAFRAARTRGNRPLAQPGDPSAARLVLGRPLGGNGRRNLPARSEAAWSATLRPTGISRDSRWRCRKTRPECCGRSTFCNPSRRSPLIAPRQFRAHFRAGRWTAAAPIVDRCIATARRACGWAPIREYAIGSPAARHLVRRAPRHRSPTSVRGPMGNYWRSAMAKSWSTAIAGWYRYPPFFQTALFRPACSTPTPRATSGLQHSARGCCAGGMASSSSSPSATGCPTISSAALIEDREANIWVATSNGLDRFRAPKIRRLSTHDGLSSNTILSIAATGDGASLGRHGSRGTQPDCGRRHSAVRPGIRIAGDQRVGTVFRSVGTVVDRMPQRTRVSLGHAVSTRAEPGRWRSQGSVRHRRRFQSNSLACR